MSSENVGEVHRYLRKHGFARMRQNGSHEVWKCQATGFITTVVRQGSKVDRNRVLAIKRQVERIQTDTVWKGRHG